MFSYFYFLKVYLFYSERYSVLFNVLLFEICVFITVSIYLKKQLVKAPYALGIITFCISKCSNFSLPISINISISIFIHIYCYILNEYFNHFFMALGIFPPFISKTGLSHSFFTLLCLLF